MPVKRRTEKRRVNAEREYEIWSSIFDGGHDFFGELPELRLGSPRPGRILTDLAREPWTRLGARWMAEHGGEHRIHPIWAAEQFGRPWENDDAD